MESSGLLVNPARPFLLLKEVIMKRIEVAGKRSKKGKPHNVYLINDKDIARAAGITPSAVRAGRCRGGMKTFNDIVKFILKRRVSSLTWR
jgi:hypothetical protein